MGTLSPPPRLDKGSNNPALTGLSFKMHPCISIRHFSVGWLVDPSPLCLKWIFSAVSSRVDLKLCGDLQDRQTHRKTNRQTDKRINRLTNRLTEDALLNFWFLFLYQSCHNTLYNDEKPVFQNILTDDSVHHVTIFGVKEWRLPFRSLFLNDAAFSAIL